MYQTKAFWACLLVFFIGTNLGQPRAAQSNPSLAFTADKLLVNPGDTLEIRWSSKNTDKCKASRDWSGSYTTQGSVSIENIKRRQLFELTCSGAKGSISKLLSVSVRKTAELTPHPLDNMEAGTWFEVPDSSFTALYPDDIPKSITANGGVAGIVDAWGGAAFDTKRERLMISGGGHHDYWGNDIFAFDVQAMQWIWLYTHADRIPHSQFYKKKAPARHAPFSKWVKFYKPLRVYSDNSPAAAHTYDGLIYLPDPYDELVFLGGTQTKRIHRFAIKEQQWEAPTLSMHAAGAGLISAFNPQNGRIYAHSVGDQKRIFQEIDVNNKRVTTLSEQGGWLNYGFTGEFDTKRNKLMFLGQRHFSEIDIRRGQMRAIRARGDDKIESLGQNPGFVYIPELDKFVAWSGGTSVYMFDPTTHYWTEIRARKSNQVNPGQANVNGTFGRFAYIPSKKGFVLLNQGNGNVYFYKLPLEFPSLQFRTSDKRRPINPFITEGDPIELQWQSKHAQNCELSGNGLQQQLDLSGNMLLSPQQHSTHYSIICSNAHGDSVKRKVTLQVITQKPLLELDFSTIQGNQINDKSGNNNHAKIRGAHSVSRQKSGTSMLSLDTAQSRLDVKLNHGFINKKNTPQTILVKAYLPKLKSGNMQTLLRFGRPKDSQGVTKIAVNKHENIRAGIHYGTELRKSFAYKANSWQTLALVFNGRDMSLFVEGKPIARGLKNKGDMMFGPNLTIFGLGNGNTRIEKIAIWQRALKDHEIKTLSH